ncbi:MAG: nuclear transport factor 2 family protein [Acidobacteria bacterium]|nr:nuclear transport factor 2 family protein [Acidobacteriota bacterium]
MKTCPSCNSQYTDDTLRFCLQDGTPLVEPSGAPTIAFNEQETFVSARPTNPPIAGFERQTQPMLAPAPAPARSNLLIVAVLILAVLLLAFVGVGAWIIYTGGSPYSRTNPMLANANTDKPVTSSKPRTDTAVNKPASNVKANSNANADSQQIKTDVAERIETWRTGIEAVNLDRFMENYAESVDYYNGRGTTRAAVRDDKQRAFVKFDSMKMTISNMTITPGAGGTRAVAVFDKEWIFTNAAGERNAGKVRQQLTLEKINGKWLIILEKDLKIIQRPS